MSFTINPVLKRVIENFNWGTEPNKELPNEADLIIRKISKDVMSVFSQWQQRANQFSFFDACYLIQQNMASKIIDCIQSVQLVEMNILHHIVKCLPEKIKEASKDSLTLDCQIDARKIVLLFGIKRVYEFTHQTSTLSPQSSESYLRKNYIKIINDLRANESLNKAQVDLFISTLLRQVTPMLKKPLIILPL